MKAQKRPQENVLMVDVNREGDEEAIGKCPNFLHPDPFFPNRN